MGDYAEDALRQAMRRGIPHRPGPVVQRPKTHPCPLCERVSRGADALKAHMKAKHGGDRHGE